jgi:hypothetical protein
MTWGDWSVRWAWVERAAAFDRFVDRQKRVALADAQVEAARRHARALQAAISVATIPLRIALETAATPPGLEMLRTAAWANAAGLRAAVAEARSSAAGLPALAQAERLALGMNTDNHEYEDAPAADPISMRIASDPAAMDLAIRLLDLVARPSPSPRETRLGSQQVRR